MTASVNRSLEIRSATLPDTPALSRLFDELGYPAPAETIAARLAVLNRLGETLLVAARGTEVLGFVSVHVTPVLHRPTSVGRMTALIVEEKSRGQGIGRALVAAAEKHLIEKGCALVEVTSNQKLTAAHAFYERLGYSITSYRFGKTLPA